MGALIMTKFTIVRAENGAACTICDRPATWLRQDDVTTLSWAYCDRHFMLWLGRADRNTTLTLFPVVYPDRDALVEDATFDEAVDSLAIG